MFDVQSSAITEINKMGEPHNPFGSVPTSEFRGVNMPNSTRARLVAC